jgi:hypothetical protein
MARKKFRASEVRQFLAALDRRLTKPFHVVAIGSTAAMFAFGLESDTRDFDTIGVVDSVLEDWAETAIQTGLDIPLDKVSVHEPPSDFESRLRDLYTPEYVNIRVTVPEKHDWALMKISRFLDKDIDHISEVAVKLGFSKEIFFERFLNEMWISNGNLGELIWSFIAMMEKLFGSKVAKEMDKMIRADKRWKY